MDPDYVLPPPKQKRSSDRLKVIMQWPVIDNLWPMCDYSVILFSESLVLILAIDNYFINDVNFSVTN